MQKFRLRPLQVSQSLFPPPASPQRLPKSWRSLVLTWMYVTVTGGGGGNWAHLAFVRPYHALRGHRSLFFFPLGPISTRLQVVFINVKKASVLVSSGRAVPTSEVGGGALTAVRDRACVL